MEAGSWHRVDPVDVPAEGRVRSVTVDGRTVALARCGAGLGALENRCPQQGGPLGEASIENGWLRCPWHGYDYDPLTGRPPEGVSDGAAAYEVAERADGVYVRLPAPAPNVRTVADVLVETLVAFGITHVFGMVGHSNLGFADAMRRAEERGQLTFTGIRHEGAASFAASAYGKLTGRPAACFAIAGPGSTNMLTGLYDAKLDQSPVLAISGQVPSKVLGRGAFQDLDLTAIFGDVAAWTAEVHAGKPILQIDDTPAAIGRFDPVGAGITGDAALTLDALLAELGATRTEDQRPAVAARWAIWRAEKARRAADERGRGVSAAAVFDSLSRHLPHDAIITVDVGNHAYSLGRYLESAGQPVLMSGYLGSIGFGYPAALGAWAAAPGRPVVAVTGDGGFGQYAAELTTAVKYGIPIKHVLLDNHSLGKISKEQLAADFPVWHTSLHNPDWAAYARLCGATGIKADCRDQLDQAMTQLFAADGPAMLHVSQDPELL